MKVSQEIQGFQILFILFKNFFDKVQRFFFLVLSLVKIDEIGDRA